MASNWAVLGQGLGVVQANMASMAQALPEVWGGDAAAAAQGRIVEFSEGFAVQSEGTALIAAAMQDMLVATKAVMELVAELLSLVDEVVLKVAASVLGWAKEIATGGASCRTRHQPGEPGHRRHPHARATSSRRCCRPAPRWAS